MTTIGFIGAGNMGMALINGFMKSISANTKDVEVYVYDVDDSKKNVLSELGVKWPDSEIELAKVCKYIFLITKPQQLSEPLKKIAPYVNAETVLVSLCAGISEEFINKYINPHNDKELKIILVMPNTPMMLGLGASAAARGRFVNDDEFFFVRTVLESTGVCEEIPIDKMNEIICVNGSSPAFIYLFAKQFANYAAEQGIRADAALSLFSQTLIGAAKMLTVSGKTADELITQVSSKGGTTIAGLEELYKADFGGTVRKACEACTARAYELGKST